MILANIFQPLIDLFEAVLVFFHDQFGASWGLSIILLTVVVRAALLPLAVKQFRSMQALQRIAPQLKEIQEKYKDDPQRRNQETMRFYQEHKVNPFASCLPILAQLPVFLSLFYLLRSDLRVDICGQSAKACGEIGQPEKWFFITDITDKATGGVLVALIAIYIGSQLISSLLMMTATTDKTQRMIILALPFVFVPFIYQFPAGLIMYWITTNLWTIGQQQFLRRVIGRNEPPLPEPVNDGEGGGLFGRLAKAMEEAQASQPGKGAKGAAKAQSGAATTKEKRSTKAPPPPPRQRKRKKRSGRRR
jgi:YidC/Oxa1 family membrane protein insertase